MADITMSEECNFAGHSWLHYAWSDGNEIYSTSGVTNISIERVVGEKSRRKNWCVVDRRAAGRHDTSLYPPKLHPKSFKTIEEAAAVFVMLEGAGVFKGGDEGT